MSSRTGDDGSNSARRQQSKAQQPQPGHRSSPARPEGSAAAAANLRGRFSSALALIDRTAPPIEGVVADKPDTKRLDLGSPVSPLRAAPSSTTTTGLTNTSSSSSSSGSVTGRAQLPLPPRAVAASARREPLIGKSHSGELSGGSSGAGSPTAVDSHGSGGVRVGGASGLSRPGHRRTGSGPLIYAGGSGSGSGSAAGGGVASVSSPPTNVLPAGNICPSGKIGKTGMMPRTSPRSDVLGSGTGNYGHGSIMRGGVGSVSPSARHSGGAGTMLTGNTTTSDLPSAVRRAMSTSDPEELARAAKEQYSKGQFAEAIRLYDKAIAMCPDSAPCRNNRAAALIAMGRLAEAVRELEETVRLDPTYGRAHQRLASLHIRLAQVELAQKHLYLTGELPDPADLLKLQAIGNHLKGCVDARKIGDWNALLRESEATIAAGADSSVLLIASKAEALLRLHRTKEAESALSNTVRLELLAPSSSQTNLFDMPSSCYLCIVKAQVEMAMGRFENAESVAEKARSLDPQNKEVTSILGKVKAVARARTRGKQLFESGRYSEACLAYGEGLRFDPSSHILYCNRAVCHSKLEQWQKSVDDCTEALKLLPNFTKALLRRATSYTKLEKWSEAVHDYEALRKELPQDKEVAEALFHAQIALKTSRGEEVSNMSFGGEVEVILGAEQYGAAISLPGVSVMYFMSAQDTLCEQISPNVDRLCRQYPSVSFHKVNVEENKELAKRENIVMVPTFRFYKNGGKLKEIICPSQQVLEFSVRNYSL